MPDIFDKYGSLDLHELVAEWKFWSSHKLDHSDLGDGEAAAVASHLDKLIAAKNANHIYLSLEDANGETVDWFKADSWA